MPKLFKLNNEKLLEKVKIKEFIDERKELRDLFRKNMENNFFPDLKFLDIEYYIFNPNTKKNFPNRRKGKDKKLIQQISDYIRLLKENKNDSQAKLIENFYSDSQSERKIPFWKKSDYNWHLIKGICISSDFTEGQLGLADDLGLFIMWVERYENGFYLIEKDNEIEWLKTGEKQSLPKTKIFLIDREPPKWVEKLEKWLNEEVKKLVSEYSFEIKKTSSGTYSCPPSRKVSFLTIAYKNPFNSKIWLLTPKIYLAEPSENLIDQFSLQKKEGTNYYYEIIDKKGNENFREAFNLINSYLRDKVKKL